MPGMSHYCHGLVAPKGPQKALGLGLCLASALGDLISRLCIMLVGPREIYFRDLSGCGIQAGGGRKSAPKRLILLAPKLISGGTSV